MAIPTRIGYCPRCAKTRHHHVSGDEWTCEGCGVVAVARRGPPATQWTLSRTNISPIGLSGASGQGSAIADKQAP